MDYNAPALPVGWGCKAMNEPDKDANSLSDLLNLSTPFAPETDEEVARRLKRPPAVDSEASSAQKASNPPAASAIESNERNSATDQDPAPRERRPREVPQPSLNSFLQDTFELIGDFARLSSAAQGVIGGSEPFSGSDQTAAITVRVDGSGRLIDFAVKSSWRKTLRIEAFEDAALEAINAAYMARANAVAAGLENMQPSQPSTPTVPIKPSLAKGSDPEAAMRQLNMVLDEFLAKVDAVEAEIQHTSPSVTETKSERRRVTLSMTDQTVTGVRVHTRWLESADPTRIKEEFVSAFDAIPKASAEKEISEGPAVSMRSFEALMASVHELQVFSRALGFDISQGG